MNHPFRHALIIGFLLAAVPAFGQNPKAAVAAPARFSDEQKADLKRISVYLNGLKSIQGRFQQIGADGRVDQGTFYLKKPGRVRFEYQKPNPNLVIADGTTVAVENSDLKTTDRYPLLNSPLRLLLSENIDLESDARISALIKEQGALSVTAREVQGPTQGSITLVFADVGAGGLELRQWEVLDAQRARTMVSVSDLRQVADIPARLFVIQDLSPFKKNK